MSIAESLADFTPTYEPWRHGGWYTNVRYPSGACGCVSRNYKDRKWRIVCDSRTGDYTYANRDAAARAELGLALALEGATLRAPQRTLIP